MIVTSDTKKGTAKRCLFFGDGLLSEIRRNHLVESLNGLLLVGTISDQLDGGALHDAQGENAQQALGVDLALLLLDPDRALELIGLLNEEGSGSGVQTNLIVHDGFLTIHSTGPPHFVFFVTYYAFT